MIFDRWENVIISLCAATLIFSCSGSPKTSLHKSSRIHMGTLVEVSVSGPGRAAEAAAKAILDEIGRVENLTSFHKASELQKINEAAGISPVRTDQELLELIGESLRFAEQTSGAFDPTIGPVTRLWQFSGAGHPRVPSEAEILEALSKVGWRRVRIDRTAGTVFLPEPGMALDLGGIAKGYALDRVEKVAKNMNVSSGLVNIGGDILAVGEKGPGRPWRVGIQDPRNASGIKAVVKLKDRVILTSGDYERFLEVNGRRYHHVLDPKTGYPASELQSVTLLTDNGMTAPAAAVFVLGVEKGLKYIESIPGLEGFLIDSDGSIHQSPGAAAMIEIQPQGN